jgi:hypothetical protein
MNNLISDYVYGRFYLTVLENPERLYTEGMYICIYVICIHHVGGMVNTVKFTKGDSGFCLNIS